MENALVLNENEIKLLFEIFTSVILSMIGVSIRESYTKLKNPDYDANIQKFILSAGVGFIISCSIPELIDNVSSRTYFILSILSGAMSYDIMQLIFSWKLFSNIIKKLSGVDVSEIIEDETVTDDDRNVEKNDDNNDNEE